MVREQKIGSWRARGERGVKSGEVQLEIRGETEWMKWAAGGIKGKSERKKRGE